MTGVEVISLGCRLNLAESERLRALLPDAGELVVVNSCAVTLEAVRQTRQAIRKARKARPEARLLVTGCAAEIEREQLAAMPEVDGLVPNAEKLDVRRYNVAPLDSGTRSLPSQGHGWGLKSSLRPSERWDLPHAGVGASARGMHTRAFIAVQNGCDHACTFCVIPQGRGPSRSLSVAQVLREVSRHLEHGAAEVVLTGVDLTGWGHDLPGQPTLDALVTAILGAFPDLRRLRLSSLDGIEIGEPLFELFAAEPRLMPHLHLSLQHGHDLILKRMKRRHRRADALDLVARLRQRRPKLAIGADLIAGFPTERDEHHQGNLSLIAELGIVHGHVFPYSPRPGTPAARMPQLDKPLIRTRAAALRAEVARQRESWLQGLVGTSLSVLAEADGTGHAENFARVVVPRSAARGTILTVTPSRYHEGLLS